MAAVTSNLPIHGPNIPGSHAILFFIASDFTCINSHIHNCVLFFLWLCLFTLSGVISPLISNSMLGTTDLGSSSFSVLSFCLSYCSWASQGKNTEVVCHSLLQWTTFCQNSPPWPVHLGGTGMVHSFIELDKAVVHVISLISFLYLWFSVCLPSDG